jgi:polysaccharide export outer membrane protein
MTRLLWLMVPALAATLVACATPDEPGPAGPNPDPVAGLTEPGQGDYRIGPDDRVQVTVWRNPELTVVAPVRPDGKISVPIIGDVAVGGYTPAQVADDIKKKLGVYIRDPNVAVILTELHSHEFLTRVRVTGAVRAPKSIPHRQGMTVLDAVLEAGGVNDFASSNRTKVYRKTKGKTEVFDIDLGDILTKGKLQTNVLLKPGDVVTVPERLF